MSEAHISITDPRKLDGLVFDIEAIVDWGRALPCETLCASKGY